MTIQKTLTPALLAMALALPGAVLAAQSDTANLAVSLKINGTCSVDSGTLTFTPVTGAITTPLSAEGSVPVTCTNGQKYAVGLGGGLHGNIAQRKMKGTGTNTINYQLYTSTSNTAPVWGMNWGTDTLDNLTGSGNAQTIKIYGRVPATANPVTDSYSDTVQVTVQYN